MAEPPSGAHLQEIRKTSRELCQKAHISINANSIERLLVSPAFKASFNPDAVFPGLVLPLKFASHLDELNVLSVLALLNFGSAYDVPLRSRTAHGSSNAVKALIFSMYITSSSAEDYLSARGMQTVSAAKIADLMGVDVHVEKPHNTIPGVIIGELGGPMYQYVKLITDVLKETGKILLESGYPNLGFFVAEALKEGGKARTNDRPDAAIDIILERIVGAIPAFRDTAVVDGQPVYIFNKVLFLINAISVRFGSISPPPFPIPSVGNLPAFANGAIPSVLVHLGIIDLSASQSLCSLWPPISEESLTALLKSESESHANEALVEETPATTESQAFCLRAATILACDSVCDVATSPQFLQKNPEDAERIKEITVPRFNSWLYWVTRDRVDYRTLPTIVLDDTVYF